MLAWVPFMLSTLLCSYFGFQQWRQPTNIWRRLKRSGLLLFIWILTAFCYTPTAYNFSGDLILHYVQWGPVKLNLVPFQQLDIEFWLNVLLTMPLGALLGWNFPHWSWRQIILAGLVTGLCLESGQFILDWLVHISRWVETDDVITNWAGVILGYTCFRIFRQVPGFKWLRN
ncbi:VanZ family protein [Lactiplantibacillus garii]|uniref:VanZ family protein n=1 Tax=Lactiplantibacillus garii TaxID=2306423 RepID=A0A426D806_9LACO|nr:VanZ family protein [Lactiplantibacillus garii]RRK10696.1 VanZ family protein [Lactiplantibacillus garii]